MTFLKRSTSCIESFNILWICEKCVALIRLYLKGKVKPTHWRYQYILHEHAPSGSFIFEMVKLSHHIGYHDILNCQNDKNGHFKPCSYFVWVKPPCEECKINVTYIVNEIDNHLELLELLQPYFTSSVGCLIFFHTNK